MTGLLRKLTVDVPHLNENSVVPLRVLTAYYKRCGSYYSSGGSWGSYGSATDEEKRLTMILFTGIFDSLSHRVNNFYDLSFLNWLIEIYIWSHVLKICF